jgi:hypothetical protein
MKVLGFLQLSGEPGLLIVRAAVGPEGEDGIEFIFTACPPNMCDLEKLRFLFRYPSAVTPCVHEQEQVIAVLRCGQVHGVGDVIANVERHPGVRLFHVTPPEGCC